MLLPSLWDFGAERVLRGDEVCSHRGAAEGQPWCLRPLGAWWVPGSRPLLGPGGLGALRAAWDDAGWGTACVAFLLASFIGMARVSGSHVN